MNDFSFGSLRMTHPLRAGSFIVTLLGDVVAPRGGEVWMGDIISFCATFGLSETLIRTAMSRLVAAGQVQGLRQGRRSYYALTQTARDEYATAAHVIYSHDHNRTWRVLCFPDGQAVARVAALQDTGLIALSDLMAIGPARGEIPAQAIAITAEAEGSIDLMRAMGAQLWPLSELVAEYGDFLDFAAQMDSLSPITASDALGLRVLLVHAFRHIVLRDPRLPAPALPDDWVGHAAQAAFARIYLDLSKTADSLVATQFASASGPLPRSTAETRSRRASLEALLRRTGKS